MSIRAPRYPLFLAVFQFWEVSSAYTEFHTPWFQYVTFTIRGLRTRRRIGREWHSQRSSNFRIITNQLFLLNLSPRVRLECQEWRSGPTFSRIASKRRIPNQISKPATRMSQISDPVGAKMAPYHSKFFESELNG